MHIALEARSLSLGSRGVRTYVSELIRHLVVLGSEDIFTIVHSSPGVRENFFPARELFVHLSHDILLPWWLGVSVPRALKDLKPDVVHFTKADVPLRRLEIPTVVTLYDLIPLFFPESQTLGRRLYWPWALKRAALLSDHIITISEASKRDIVNHLSVDPDRVTATPLAVDLHHFHPAAHEACNRVRVHYNLHAPYILFLGTRDKRKNVSALVRAFALIAKDIPHQLVIAGQAALKRDTAQQEISRLGLTSRVRVIPYLPYDDLPALYSNASVFVFPSVYEGWGLPPLEAMACGTPVIVSDGGALSEVVGDAGEIVRFTVENMSDRVQDLDFERGLAEMLRCVLTDEHRRLDMQQRGLERAKQFSWENVARRTLRVYEKVVSK